MSETIETPEALDALPVDSVVLAHWPSGEHDDHRVVRGPGRGGAGSGGWTIADERTWDSLLDWGAVLTVLYRPDAPAPPAEDREALADHLRSIGLADLLASEIARDLLAWLAARQPAPVDAETTTEWGVRHAEAGWEGSDLDTWDVRGTPYDEATARADAAKRAGSCAVQRTVTAWREVSRG